MASAPLRLASVHARSPGSSPDSFTSDRDPGDFTKGFGDLFPWPPSLTGYSYMGEVPASVVGNKSDSRIELWKGPPPPPSSSAFAPAITDEAAGEIPLAFAVKVSVHCSHWRNCDSPIYKDALGHTRLEKAGLAAFKSRNYGIYRRNADEICIVTSYEGGGDLLEWSNRASATGRRLGMKRKRRRLLRCFLRWAARLVGGLRRAGIVHGDISLENIVLRSAPRHPRRARVLRGPKGEPKRKRRAKNSSSTFFVLDFGLHSMGGRVEQDYGKALYASPETFAPGSYDGNLADAYALGVCAALLALGAAVPMARKGHVVDASAALLLVCQEFGSGITVSLSSFLEVDPAKRSLALRKATPKLSPFGRLRNGDEGCVGGGRNDLTPSTVATCDDIGCWQLHQQTSSLSGRRPLSALQIESSP